MNCYQENYTQVNPWWFVDERDGEMIWFDGKYVIKWREEDPIGWWGIHWDDGQEQEGPWMDLPKNWILA